MNQKGKRRKAAIAKVCLLFSDLVPSLEGFSPSLVSSRSHRYAMQIQYFDSCNNKA